MTSCLSTLCQFFDRELRFAQGPRNSFFSGNSSSHLFNFELILSFKDLGQVLT